MKWSVALFGHFKPRYYVQDEQGVNEFSFIEHPGEMPTGKKLHNVTGWEKRAEPGDFIVAKPDKCWKDIGRQQHNNIINDIRNKAYIQKNKEEILVNYINNIPAVIKENPRAYQNNLKRFDRIFATMFSKHPIDDRIIGIRNPRLLPNEYKQYFNLMRGSSLFHLNGKDTWSKTERKNYLIADLDELEETQTEGAEESIFDLDSYEEYAPKTKNEIADNIKNNSKINKEVKKEMLKNINEVYSQYLLETQDRCSLPRDKIKKRRFKITLDDLETMGIDIDRMLDKNILYDPNPELVKNDLFDKMKDRKIIENDNLNTIPRKEFE